MSLTTFEFDEEVHVLGIVIFRTFQLQMSQRPPFSDDWFTPIGGGRARFLAIRTILPCPHGRTGLDLDTGEVFCYGCRQVVQDPGL